MKQKDIRPVYIEDIIHQAILKRLDPSSDNAKTESVQSTAVEPPVKRPKGTA